jgi:hypothetical protein
MRQCLGIDCRAIQTRAVHYPPPRGRCYVDSCSSTLRLRRPVHLKRRQYRSDLDLERKAEVRRGFTPTQYRKDRSQFWDEQVDRQRDALQ